MQRILQLVPTITLLLLLLNAGGCKKSSGEDPPVPSPTPTLSVSGATISEGNSGSVDLVFSVTLSTTTGQVVTADFATTDGTAIAGEDYSATSGTLTIPAGTTTESIVVSVTGDLDVEPDETFQLTLSNVSAAATLGTSGASGSILNDDVVVSPVASVLNDTGVVTCSNATMNGLACNSASDGTDFFPGQDGEYGRDVTDGDDSDGYAGFAFSKLDASGNPLSDQSVDYATTPWQCVQDEVTGLMWEVKSDIGDLHDAGWTYSWFTSNGVIPGLSNGGLCSSNRDCDSEKYAMAVNVAALCGFDDWRVPLRHELMSLMNFGATAPPYIDTNVFVNHAQYPYWTASFTSGLSVAYVSFSEYGANTATPFESYALRLVRGE